MHVVSDWVVPLGIQLKTDTLVELVSVGHCVWLGWVGWHADANIVHVFRE